MPSQALTAFDDYRAMLADTVRTDAFKAAIASVVRPGDVVVDLGAGTGFLGFLALQAGASRVHLIEQTHTIDLARAIAQHNGWIDRVVFHQANSLDVVLGEPADVLISETLGSLGVEENTLTYFIDARDRFLRPGGRVIPEALTVFLCPVEHAQIFRQRVTFWKDVAGLDFTPAIDAQSRRMGLADITDSALLAAPKCLFELDLRQIQTADLRQRCRFVFQRAGTVHGLTGWFHCRLTQGVSIETGPSSPPTHWRQAWLPFNHDPVDVGIADILDLELTVTAARDRGDDTAISWTTFCSQIGLPTKLRLAIPCPCGSGERVAECCYRAP